MAISKTKLNKMINDILKTCADDFNKYKSLNYELQSRLENDNIADGYSEIIIIKDQIKDIEKEIILNAARKNRKEYSYINKKLLYVYDYKCSLDEERAKIRPHYLPEERILDILADIKKEAISQRKDFGISEYYDLMYFDYENRYEEDILNPFYGQYLIRNARKQICDEFYTGLNVPNKDQFSTLEIYTDYLNKDWPEKLSLCLKEDIFDKYERLSYWLAKTLLTEPTNEDKKAYLVSEMNNIEYSARNQDIEMCFRSCRWIPNMKTEKIIETLTERKKRAYVRATLGVENEELLEEYDEELNKKLIKKNNRR